MFSSILKKIVVFSGIFLVFTLLFSGSLVQTHAQTVDQLNILGVNCLFYDSADSAKNVKDCTEDTALFPVIQKFLLDIAPFVAVLVIIFGGFKYFQEGAESKGAGLKYIQGAVIGLIVVYSAQTIIGIIQNVFPAKGTNNDIKIESKPIIDAIVNIVNNFLIPVAVVLTVFFVVIGAYNLILSNGDAEKSKKGRAAITNAVIGLIVILLAIVIVQTVNYVTNNAVTTLGS